MNMHQGLTDWIIVFNYILALKLLKWNNHEDFFFIRYSDSCIIIIIIIMTLFKEEAQLDKSNLP